MRKVKGGIKLLEAGRMNKWIDRDKRDSNHVWIICSRQIVTTLSLVSCVCSFFLVGKSVLLILYYFYLLIWYFTTL